MDRYRFFIHCLEEGLRHQMEHVAKCGADVICDSTKDLYIISDFIKELKRFERDQVFFEEIGRYIAKWMSEGEL